MKNEEFYSKTHFLLFFNKREAQNTIRREKKSREIVRKDNDLKKFF